mgnify:CR=1 FL=1
MKKIMIFLVIGSFLVTTLAFAGSERERIKSFCQDKWGSNYNMVEHCMEEQIEGYRKVKEFVEKADSKNSKPMKKISVHCMNKWELPKFGTHNWNMVDHCMGEQMEAYQNIQ